MEKALKYINLGLVILLISMPGIQMIFRPIKEKPLNGAYIQADTPVLSKGRWDSGEFQDQAEKYLKDHAGFRNFLVRLYNQVDFSIFRKANAEGATIGQERQLYEYDYIRSWLGLDNPGESFIRKKLNRAKYVQDYLKREKNIDLVIVFEPGKASFYPEYIPGRYAEQKHGPSTFEAYLEIAREIGLDFIDFQEYFMQLKPSARYPLFPEYGTHWSVYGARFAADSLVKYIENRRNIDLAGVRIMDLETSTRPRDTDDDVLKTMNLLFEPKGEWLAYPVITFDTSHPSERPMVLVVADSYYFNIFNTSLPRHLFANEAFWFFNEAVYPDEYFHPRHTGELDLKSEVEKQDVIFLMVTERFVHKFDWTFMDNLYRLYAPEWLTDPVYENINKIMKHDPWYNELIASAGKQGITLEERLIMDAQYTMFEKDLPAYLIRFGTEHYKTMISSLPEWMAAIREKAQSRGISAEEMLELDAMYTFQNEYPDYFEIHQGIGEALKNIRKDPVMIDSVNRLAEVYRFDKDEMAWLAARVRFRENEVNRICEVIKNDESWMAHVRGKAEAQGLAVEEMIRKDAEWTFDQKMK